MPLSRFLSKKKKIGEITTHYHSLSLVVIRCHLLPLIVPLDVICCTTRCHSLSFLVTRCTTCSQSLSLDVSLVCLFINDRPIFNFHHQYSVYHNWWYSREKPQKRLTKRILKNQILAASDYIKGTLMQIWKSPYIF